MSKINVSLCENSRWSATAEGFNIFMQRFDDTETAALQELCSALLEVLNDKAKEVELWRSMASSHCTTQDDAPNGWN